ncbi:MAG: hypothetical protein EOM50_21825 [Erysipelotrichia bacterium]|nr:hypothetical protein [Erysipelotrichia bacterium]NCC54345.1 hypothetical protein [Erysipelotrichia bacterium]
MVKHLSLIDDLTKELNLLYTSDLKMKIDLYASVICDYVCAKKDQYTQEDWLILYCYLSGKSKKEITGEDIYEKLVQYLEKKK